MKTKKDMKETLRYKHMVARLQHLAPYKKGAALMQEIAKGVQWRMDAALEAIKKDDWDGIDQTAVLKQAAMFGRLQTVNNISDALGFEKQRDGYAPLPVQAAFNVAAQHGNFKTADALFERGAQAGVTARDGTPSPVVTALGESDARKINFLIKRGVSAGDLLYFAAIENNLKAARHLVEKKSADVNHKFAGHETPYEATASDALKQYLLDHGAKKPQAEPPVEMSTPAPLQLPVSKPQPAITAEMLKGTKFETNLETAMPLILEAWKIPAIPAALLDALRGVEKTATGISFTLVNGHKLDWDEAKQGREEFIGRRVDAASFDSTDARATVAAALARGWKAMNVIGDKNQQEAMWLEAQRQGIQVANFRPDEGSDVKKLWDVEKITRQKAAANPPPVMK